MVARQPGRIERPDQRGGGPDQAVGPNPTARGQAGSKRHLLVDRWGIPLAVWLTAATVHDSRVFEVLIEAVAPLKAATRPTTGPP